MMMSLLAGCALFLICFFLHVVLWRVVRPKNDIHALFWVFIIVPAAIAPLLLWAPAVAPAEAAAALLLALTLSAAYIQTYPAIQASSPSLVILIAVGKKMPQGATAEELSAGFDDKRLVGTRLEDLRNTRLIIENNGSISLAPAAKIVIRFFILYRKALGLPYRGG